MNHITNEELAQIRNNTSITDIVSSYIPLTKKGKNHVGVCPFHQDTNPSMSVSSEKQIYTCFACGATGNAFKFVMDYENVSFPEAVKIVAEKAGISIQIQAQKDRMENKYLEQYEIYELAQKFYQNNINTDLGQSAKQYLMDRGLQEEIMKEFGIGLSLKNKDMLFSLLTKKGFGTDYLLKSGLISKNEYGFSDMYHERIMFPLHNPQGQVVGYSGRIYQTQDGSKYINTRETDIFKKGELLYNYHRAKDACRNEGSVIVMEGFMDVIRAHSVGMSNVIATMGTAVTKEQALLMKRLAKDVYLCFDGDTAGKKAAIACSEELLKVGVLPQIITLPEKLDPDDFILKYGKEAFLQKMVGASKLLDFKIDYHKQGKDFTSSNDVAEYINLMLLELEKIDDDILREVTIKKMSDETGIDYLILKEKLKGKETVIKVPKTVKNNPVITKVKTNKYSKAEQYLLWYMFTSKEVITIYSKEIPYMPTEKYRKLATTIVYFYKDHGYVDLSELMLQSNYNDGLLQTIGEIEALGLKEEYTTEEIYDYIRVIKEYNINYEVNRLREKMTQTMDHNEKIEIALKIAKMKRGGVEND